jgi:hypothetical protein
MRALEFALLIVAMVGCKSTGSGMGESATGNVRAHFTWQQSDPVSGTLTAMVSKKKQYVDRPCCLAAGNGTQCGLSASTFRNLEHLPRSRA